MKGRQEGELSSFSTAPSFPSLDHPRQLLDFQDSLFTFEGALSSRSFSQQVRAMVPSPETWPTALIFSKISRLVSESTLPQLQCQLPY